MTVSNKICVDTTSESQSFPAVRPLQEYLNRILASRTLSGSGLLKRLLSELVTKLRRGEADDLNEYYLAEKIFGRKDFDPRIDSIVRVQIRRLRCKLAEYYRNGGRYDAVRIDIPKGSYIPVLVPAGIRSVAQRKNSGRSGCKYRIAVLPVLDLSADVDVSFARAVTENLIDALTQVESLDVMGRTSVVNSQLRDLRTAGKELDVDMLLESSIQRREEMMQVNIRLVSAETGFTLRAKAFKVEIYDRWATKERISICIVSFMNSFLSEYCQEVHQRAG